MLDEYREYSEYTCKINGGNCAERIKYGTMVRSGANFAGLERILTIIARYYLFYHGDKNETDDRDRAAAYAAVRSWLGYTIDDYEALLDDDIKKEIKAIKGWIRKYIRTVMIPGRNDAEEKKKLKTRINKLGKWEYFSDLFKSCYDNGLWRSDDLNELTLEKAVANAASRKGLKRFYLACGDPGLDELKTASGKKLSRKSKDKLLKIVAAYLLENYYIDKEVRSTSRFAPFSKTDFSYWYSDGYMKDLPDIRLNGSKLIENFSRDSDTKIRFNSEWLQNCGWTLIDATEDDSMLEEYLAAHEGHHFYRDNGANKALTEGEVYER